MGTVSIKSITNVETIRKITDALGVTIHKLIE